MLRSAFSVSDLTNTSNVLILLPFGKNKLDKDLVPVRGTGHVLPTAALTIF